MKKGQLVQTYTVYEKRVAPEDVEERAADLVFVKEGFSVWTFIFPPIWLIPRGLWRGLLLYVAAVVALFGALLSVGLAEGQAGGWGLFVIHLLFGFEARDIYRASLERRGYIMKSIVSGRNLAECEQRYLLEWLPEAKRDGELMATAAAADASGQGSPSPIPIIGMFPSHGG